VQSSGFFLLLVALLRKILCLSSVASQEQDRDHLASRLSKTSQLLYRFAGLMCLLEHALKISDDYLASYESFGTNEPSQTTFDRLQSIVDRQYGYVLGNGTDQHLPVDSLVADRAKEITLANLEQYKLLLFVDRDDGRN
jgi:hypothetical protein